jgi:glycosyltransferase involved in cell wall biosynthesis
MAPEPGLWRLGAAHRDTLIRMSSDPTKPELVLLAPSWPGLSNGYGIAISSSLRLYLESFSKIHFICITEDPFTEADQWPDGRIRWIHTPIQRRNLGARFLISILKSKPAITIRYLQARKAVLGAIQTAMTQSHAPKAFIVEDIPTAAYLPDLARRWPDTPCAVRSHNMTEMAFERFRKLGSLPRRVAWSLELARIRRFERDVFRRADVVWAISEEDNSAYLNRMGVQADGILGVCMDVDRYANVGASELMNIVHVGSADLRKGRGLHDFIANVWPIIRAQEQDARLILAGGGTQSFADPARGIEGLGFVEDERDVLERGLLFLNPQHIGSGIQLKSIVAMLAGKVLVSTPMGAQGIEGEAGTHFVVAESPEAMAADILSLIQDPAQAKHIALSGRELAVSFYRPQRFLDAKKSMLSAFVERITKKANT